MGKKNNSTELGLNEDLMNEWLQRTSRRSHIQESPTLLPGQVKAVTGGTDFGRLEETLQSSNINIFDNTLQEQLGERQSAADKWGNFAMQVGAEILGGTIEGIGYLGDVQGTAQVLDGDMTSFGNWLSDIGIAMKEGSREYFPIFGDANGMSNLGWWLSNGVSVASSLSLLIPAAGTIRGIGMLGKAMGLAGKLGKSTKMGLTVLGQAVTSRHMENMMEASQVFDETRNFAIQEGRSMDEANRLASEAASTLYKTNYLLLGQDVLSFGLLAKGPKISKAITSRRMAKALGQNANLASLQASYNVLGDMASEGVEEGLQYIFAEEAKYKALSNAGLVDEESFGERLGGYLKEGELYKNMFFGALGAGVMQAGGAALQKTGLMGGKEDAKALQARIDHAVNSTENTKAAAIKFNAAVQKGDEGGIRAAQKEMAFNLAYNSAALGNFDLAMANIDDLINAPAEEATAEGTDFAPDYKERLTEVKKDMQVVADLYRKNAKKYAASTVEGITLLQYQNKDFNEQLQTLESKQAELKSQFPMYNQLSASGQEQFDLLVEQKGLEQAIAAQDAIMKSPGAEKLSVAAAKIRKGVFESRLKEVNNARIALENQEQETLDKGGDGAIPANNRRRIERDRKILDGFEGNGDDLASNSRDFVQTANIIQENNDALKELTSIEGQNARIELEKKLAKEQAKAKAEAEKAKKEAEKAEKEAAKAESVSQSRREHAAGKKAQPSKEGTVAGEEAENEAEAAAAGAGTKRMKIQDFTDEELDQKLAAATNPAVKKALHEEKTRREKEIAAGKRKRANKTVIEGENIIEVVGADEAQTPSNDEQKEYDSTNYSEVSEDLATEHENTLVAETGFAIAWKSTTGMDVVQLAENFEDQENAKALTEFLEDPAIDKRDFTLEFYVDKERLRESKNYAEGVEEHLQSLYTKLTKGEKLTEEELGVLPVRAFIVNKEGQRISKKGNPITLAVHDTTFGGWEKLSEEKRKQAQTELIGIKEAVLQAAMDGKVATAPIEEQRKGILITEQDGIKFKENNLSVALDKAPSEMRFVIGDKAPEGQSAKYIESTKEPADDLAEYRSATPGAVYAVIKAANGQPFPLRVFTSNLTTAEAELVYELYAITLEDEGAYKQNLGKHQDLIRKIKNSSDPRVSGLAEITNLSKITIADILKLLVYEGVQTKNSGDGALFSTAKKTIRVGDVSMNMETFLSDAGKASFLEKLKNKRRQISSSLLDNNAYKNYLVSNNIITTNATNINGVMFKAPTTIFGDVQVKEAPKAKPAAEKSGVSTESAQTKADIERRIIQMQPDNVAKILAGTKTTTTRSESQAKKINIPVGKTAIVNIGGEDFLVTNRGLLTIQEAGGRESIEKSEDFENNTPKYQQTKEWLNGKGKLYVYDIVKYDAELAALEGTGATSAKEGFNGIGSVEFTNPNVEIKGFTIDGNYYNVITGTDRAKTLVTINGVTIPFYLTSGHGGKGLIPGWYPFFGIGMDGWLNKTNKADMENFYADYWGAEVAELVRQASEDLNNAYGTDPSAFQNDADPTVTVRPLMSLLDKVEDYIRDNISITPTSNEKGAKAALAKNIAQLGKEITEGGPTASANNAQVEKEFSAPEVVAQIQEDTKHLKLSSDERTYIDERTGQVFQRVTDFISTEEVSDNNYTRAASAIGTKVDDLVRDFFEGKISKDSPMEDIFAYGIGDTDMVIEYLEQLEGLAAELKAKGQKVVASGITLHSKSMGVAGTVDLLAYDAKGNVFIYDMKTMRGNQLETTHKSGPNAGKNKYDFPYNPGQDSNRVKHQKQLSMYNLLLEDTYGVRANGLAILPIEVFYPNEPGVTQTETLKALPTVPVNFDAAVYTKSLANSESDQSGDTVVSAEKTEEDFTDFEETPGISLDELDNLTGTVENKEGAINTQHSDEIATEEMENSISLDELDALLNGDPGPASEKYSDDDFNNVGFKTRDEDVDAQDTITQSEVDAVTEMVPNDIAVEVVSDYIKLLSDGASVVGMFHENLITISTKAKSGDGFHEAFHAVFRTMLTQEEQRALLDEARNLFKPMKSDIDLLVKRHKISRKKAEDLFYEEQLADEFGVYALNPGAYQFKDSSNRENFFKRLLSWIKDILGVTGNMEKIFKNIKEGKYRNGVSVDAMIQSGVIKSKDNKTGKPC